MTSTSDPLVHHRAEAEARKPWLYAEGESWWIVTGQVAARHNVTECIAQVVPEFVTGVARDAAPALFAVHTWGGKPTLLPADQITTARRLAFVFSDEPGTAFYADEQVFVSAALRGALDHEQPEEGR